MSSVFCFLLLFYPPVLTPPRTTFRYHSLVFFFLLLVLPSCVHLFPCSIACPSVIPCVLPTRQHRPPLITHCSLLISTALVIATLVYTLFSAIVIPQYSPVLVLSLVSFPLYTFVPFCFELATHSLLLPVTCHLKCVSALSSCVHPFHSLLLRFSPMHVPSLTSILTFFLLLLLLAGAGLS